jgi:hypothetical protein
MITVVSTWVNHPEVIALHRDLWTKAFSGESIRYVAYIDAKDYGDFSNFGDASMKEQLIKACVDSSIEYLLVPQEYHMQRHKVFETCNASVDNCPSARDALVCQYIWNREVLNGSVNRLVLVQSDIFPYRTFTWNSILRGADFYYRPQVRSVNGESLHYAWEGLCFFDTSRWPDARKDIVDFEYGFQKGIFTDTGGGLWRVLEVLKPEQKRPFLDLHSGRWSISDAPTDLPFWITEHIINDPRNTIKEDGTTLFYSEIFDNSFFHLRAGGNWDNAGKEIHDVRYSRFLDLISHAMNDQTVFI